MDEHYARPLNERPLFYPPPHTHTPPLFPRTGQLDFPEFGRNLEEFMAKKGTPVKRVVMSKEGLSHVEAQVPGDDYPEVNPHLATEEGDGLLLSEGFDGTSLLPGAHVGGASYLPGVPPPPPPAKLGGGVGGGDGDVEGIVDGAGSDVV